MNSRVFLIVCDIDLGAVSEQELDHALIAGDDGQQQGRIALQVLPVDDPLVQGEEKLGARRVAVLGTVMQRRLACIVNFFHKHLEERVNCLQIF